MPLRPGRKQLNALPPGYPGLMVKGLHRRLPQATSTWGSTDQAGFTVLQDCIRFGRGHFQTSDPHADLYYRDGTWDRIAQEATLNSFKWPSLEPHSGPGPWTADFCKISALRSSPG